MEFDDAVQELGNPAVPYHNPTTEMFKECLCEIQENHDQLFGIPTLPEIGFVDGT